MSGRKRPTSRIYGETARPVLQVPASPSPNAGTKRPISSLYANLSRPNGPQIPPSLSAGSNRSTTAPVPKPRPSSASEPGSGTGSSPPIEPTGTGRLLSLSKFSYKPKGSSTVFSRYADLLTRGQPEKDESSMSANEEKVFHQLKAVFPTATNQLISATVKTYKTFDASANWLAKQDLDASNGASDNVHSPPPKRHARDSDDGSTAPGSPDAKRPEITSKRQVDRPHMTIRERFAAARAADEGEPIIPQHQASATGSSGSGTAPKRKLVKGKSSASFIEEPIEDMDDSDASEYENEVDYDFDNRVLSFLNTASLEDIADIAACSHQGAQAMIDARPFDSLDDAREVQLETTPAPEPETTTKGRGRRMKKPAGDKIVNDCSSTLHGYEAVDSLIQKCEELGKIVSDGIKSWGVSVLGSQRDGELDITEVDGDGEEDGDGDLKPRSRGGYFSAKPTLVPDDVQLKSYQQVGINWLSLLYNKGLSCILADEMGLGKTCQVISFLAHLQQIGSGGPHLVVVPASTLENWLREFQKFCPSLKVEPYYGSQQERAEIRDTLMSPDAQFDVIVTTYNLACGAKPDMGFLKSIKFNVCVYDEGHMLKNSQSERYTKLMRLKAGFRLLLTGTPLQNNLRELVSLLSFILPSIFQDRKEELAGIFKHKAKATAAANSGSGTSGGADTNGASASSTASASAAPEEQNPLLSEQRITKAKAMMTPFILRRKKDQVLQHLPKKVHAIEYCDMTDRQRELYLEELEVSRRNVELRQSGGRAQLVNVMMQLRKAAIHPLLFRRLYTTEILKTMAREILAEPVYREANEQYIFEDMEVMSDYELHVLCEKFADTIGHHALESSHWLDSGKVGKLAAVLPQMQRQGDRVLLFSQFTQMLDILERVLSQLDIAFLRLDGSTPVDVRQEMIDKFTRETDITVFLLSTKAGGFGINLASANTVIIHDLSFNPHDDKQAEDRAHRVGQTREVNVTRLITKDSVEESILQLANTKLALDASVTSDEKEAEKAEATNASLVAKMIFSNLPSESSTAVSTPAP